MREPRPWLEDDATEIEKSLLRAGRADGPRADADARILAAIQGLSPFCDGPTSLRPSRSFESVPAAAGGAGPATSARPVELFRWAKVGLFAVGVSGSAAVAHHLARPRVLASSAMSAPSAPVTLPASALSESGARLEAPGLPRPLDGLATPLEEEPHRGPGGANARGTRSSPTGRTREATPESSASPLDRDLGDEITALDRARQSLKAHRASEGLRLLDEYHRTFPQGRLRPEAMVLRLAALVQAGKHGAADSLAAQLLADETYKPYALRIRSLMREAKP